MICIIIIFTIEKYIMSLNILYLYTILLPSDAYECNLPIVLFREIFKDMLKNISE